MSHSAIERFDRRVIRPALGGAEPHLPHFSPDAGMRLSAHPRSLSHRPGQLTVQANSRCHFVTRAPGKAHTEMLVEVFHGAAHRFGRFDSKGIAGCAGKRASSSSVASGERPCLLQHHHGGVEVAHERLGISPKPCRR